MFKAKRKFEIAIVGLVAAGLAGAAIAQDAAAHLAARQKDMQTVQASMQAISKALGENSLPGVKAEADKMNAAFKDFGTHFPAGTDAAAGKTRAKAEVWSNADAFKAAVDNAVAKTDALSKAAGSGNLAATEAASGEVNGLCYGCHTPFRGR
jgi:cytochrome c556